MRVRGEGEGDWWWECMSERRATDVPFMVSVLRRQDHRAIRGGNLMRFLMGGGGLGRSSTKEAEGAKPLVLEIVSAGLEGVAWVGIRGWLWG